MIEKIRGLSIRGKCFDEEKNFQFFPKDNDRLSIVFGRNGSGKSTLAKGFSTLIKSSEEISVKIIDKDSQEIIHDTDDNRIFVFDEDYIDNKIKFKQEGLNTIVLFGQQVDIDKILEEKKKGKKSIEEKLTKLQEQEEKYKNKKSPESKLYYMESIIIPGLRKDGGWADKEREIKQNKAKARVNEEKAIEICKTFTDKTLILLEKDYRRLTELLAKSSLDTHDFNDKIDAISINSNIDNYIINILKKVIKKPVLTEREEEIYAIIQDGHLDQINSAKDHFSLKETHSCPYCFREISKDCKTDLVDSINKVINKESYDYNDELESLYEYMPKILGDYSCFEDIDKEAVVSINKTVENIRKTIIDYSLKIKERQEKIFTTVEVTNYNLEDKIILLNKMLAELERSREIFVNDVKQVKKNREKRRHR